MSMKYKLLLTELGQAKLVQASTNGIGITIAEFAVGQGVDVDFSERLDKQTLVSKRYQATIESVSQGTQVNQYVVQCKIPVDEGGFTVREVGLIDSHGDLIWVGSLPQVELPPSDSLSAVDYRLNFPIQIDNPDITLVIDTNVMTATKGWVGDNFVPRSALELIFPFGYPYWTHTNQNPKSLFDALFGYETFWRRVEGVNLVAVDDNDPYINQPMQLLGQKGNTDRSVNTRPHHYPIYSKYLFERYDPDFIIDNNWRITANKSAVTEGDGVTFTVAVNNMPDGQIVNWRIDEGVLSTNDNSIINAEKTATGTAVINNGLAIISYISLEFDYEAEEQKHIRVTLDSPANLAMNVPIIDRGHLSQVIEEFDFSVSRQAHQWIGKHGILMLKLDTTPFPSKMLSALEFDSSGYRSSTEQKLVDTYITPNDGKGSYHSRIWLYIPKDYTPEEYSIDVTNSETAYEAEWVDTPYHSAFDSFMTEEQKNHNNWMLLYVKPSALPVYPLHFHVTITRR